MRRFYASPDQITDSVVTLNAEETRHLRDVLRLRTGEIVQVFDGIGREFSCEIEGIGRRESILKNLGERQPSAPESDLELTLAVALLKGEKFDLVIQKAVEIGVTRLVPIITKRTDVKLKDADKKLERWRKIILESSKQCGRAKLMQIDESLELTRFIGTANGYKVLFSERDGEAFSTISGNKRITALIGSEGGWDDSEIDYARQNGVQIVTLGGRILRAETAAIIIPAMMQNHFGDLV